MSIAGCQSPPTRLYYCLDDDIVPYSNATVALEYFMAVGADGELETLPFGSHVGLRGSGFAQWELLVQIPGSAAVI